LTCSTVNLPIARELEALLYRGGNGEEEAIGKLAIGKLAIGKLAIGGNGGKSPNNVKKCCNISSTLDIDLQNGNNRYRKINRSSLHITKL
jgi:hypothetical protein